ncbi:alginate O-acetyltransferase AlgX-related protein [Martelella radicis]|uniref:Alginate biosynthesis protein AlgX n=1 Tax=Martelella radicis TaxID=1397476 RepID=A0A7W6KK73_9HYPH|nr:hypothetical protein [Martelella radicis]MBB4121418.1 alginate biosynthesis protein AlgX [Martelella radicis]
MDKAGLTTTALLVVMAATGGALAQQDTSQTPVKPFQMTQDQPAPQPQQPVQTPAEQDTQAAQEPAAQTVEETVTPRPQTTQPPQPSPQEEAAVSSPEAGQAPPADNPPQTAMADQAAQTSQYGCANLEDLDPPALEGPNGFFFTVMDDIAMQQVADPALVESISDLAKRLRARGTVLVYVPVPSKSQAMPDEVPEAAWVYGYNESVNAEIYDHALSRLNAADVVAVDLKSALQKADPATPPFQKVDPLWTPEGARLAAEAVAQTLKSLPAYRKANLMTFKTTEEGQVTRPSELRTALQTYCSDPLPPVFEKRYETAGEEAYAADRPFNVLGADAPAPAVLVGSRFSAGGQSHFDGFLKQASGLDVSNRASADSYPFQSIDGYLQSQDFQDHPPLFLIWEVPAGSNLARFGPLPWLTLSANAAGDCSNENATCGESGAEK